MTKNSTLKNLLRTTAIVGTLFMGSQTWGGTLVHHDHATDPQTALGAAVYTVAANEFKTMTAAGSAVLNDAAGGISISSGGSLVIFGDAQDAGVDIQAASLGLVLADNSKLYWVVDNGGAGAFILSDLGTTATSVSNANLYLAGNATLMDLRTYPGIKVNIIHNGANITLTGAAATDLANTAIDVGAGATLIPATWTSCAALSGSGAVSPTTALTVNGNVTGTLAITQASAPISVLGNMTTTAATVVGASETFTVTGNASLGAVTLDGLLNIGGTLTTGGTVAWGSGGILQLAGALSGTSQLNMASATAPFTHTGTTSGFTGAVVLPSAANVTFANAPKSAFTNLRGNSLTFTNGGTVTSIATAATGGTIAGGTGCDLTITTLTQGDSHHLTLNPGTGKKMTVTTLTQDAGYNENLTIGTGGTMVFSGTVNINAATHTFGSATTVGTYNVAGAPTAVNINENTTINSLTLGANNVDFAIAAGKTLTIKAVTGSGNITGSASGTISVKSSSTFTGDVLTTGATVLKTN